MAGRAVLVRALDMLKVEAIARAYLTGGGLDEYRERGSVCGVGLAAGLVEGSKLPEPIFTPTTKAPVGEHDLPIRPTRWTRNSGRSSAQRCRARPARSSPGARDRRQGGHPDRGHEGEFGSGPDGPDGLILADEVLTPDSSRFWPAELWAPGGPQPSYDKQFVRDWLTSPSPGWDRRSGEAPPELPAHIIEQTRAKYVEAYERLTGETF